ncbi:MAG: EAL domain-containing protein [Myxococcota bacterium]
MPFRMGRSKTADFVVHSTRVSKLHAEFDVRGDEIVLRDLQSRNGTYLNGQRIRCEVFLNDGDVLHLAHREFRFRSRGAGTDDAQEQHTSVGQSEDTERFIQRLHALYRVLNDGELITAVFQPIVAVTSGVHLGFEALARTELPSGSVAPSGLFEVAEKSQASELSQRMRMKALAHAVDLPLAAHRIFINVHASELSPARLPELLHTLPTELLKERILVLEIHERAVSDIHGMAGLKEELHSRGIELAYDDFGAGQSRLVELAEVPPDFIKLDMRLVRGIDRSPARQDLVSALCRVMQDQGIRVIAEGIETPEELEVCRELECDFAQGFLISRPQSAEHWGLEASG